ncbi:MAG: MFS transporter [Pseudomonadota bacterium]
MSSRVERVSATDRWLYASGSFGTGVFSTIPSILLLYYCTEILGLAAAAVSLILLFPKLISLIWDPIVGMWSDNTRLPLGRRKPFLIVGAVGTSAMFVALFAPPDLPASDLLIWVAVSYTALSLLYSLFAVPYTALPADLSNQESDVVRFVSARMILLMIGILAGASVAPILVSSFGGGRQGYALMSIAIGIAALVFMSTPMFMSRAPARAPSAPTGTKGFIAPTLMKFRAVFTNSAYRPMLLAFILQTIAYGGVSAAFPFLTTVTLNRSEADTGIGLGIMVVMSLVFVPVWSFLARQTGLIPMIIVAVIGYACSTILLASAVGLSGVWTHVIGAMVLCGAFFSGLQVLPFAMASEIARRTAPSTEGQYSGVWIAFEKSGLAGGAFLLSLMMTLGEPGQIALIFVTFVPAIFLLASLLFLVRTSRALKSPTSI